MLSSGTHWWCSRVGSFLPDCCTQRITISGLTYTGTHLYNKVKNMLDPKNAIRPHSTIFLKILNAFFIFRLQR